MRHRSHRHHQQESDIRSRASLRAADEGRKRQRSLLCGHHNAGSGVAMRPLSINVPIGKFIRVPKGLGLGLGGQRDGLPPALEPLSMGAGQLSGTIVRPDHQETITDRFRAVDLQWMWVGDSPTATQPTEGRTKTRPVDTFNEDRGLTPGDTVGLQCTQCHLPTFNEGRGFTPGDTNPQRFVNVARSYRSMRVGGSPPATPPAPQMAPPQPAPVVQ